MLYETELIRDLLIPLLALATTALLGVIAWTGKRLQDQIDGIPMELEKINRTLHVIEVELRSELSNHEVRIGYVEERVKEIERREPKG
jgi:hypothetical protein